jgi:GNAT superfamily N-acetyltransferase
MTTLESTAALLAKVFPGTSVARPEYLEWLYERSPFGAVLESNLDDEHGRAGHCAFVPIILSRDGLERRCALSVNTAVHERARGRGVFAKLASETVAKAQIQGVEAVVGVSNANSTPIFLGPLNFDLLTPLPASVMVPTPGPRRAIRSCWADGMAFAAGGVAADLDQLLAAPLAGEARLWTPTTLRWRLAKPGTKYALHRADGLLAVSCVDSRYRIPVAILSKVFATASVDARLLRALVRTVCSFHKAPIALHVGLNDRVHFRGVALPARLRESPLNLIYRSLVPQARRAPITNFEFLDFDVY